MIKERIISILFLMGLFFVSPLAFSHGDEESRVEILSDAPEVMEAGKVRLVFQLRDKEEKKLLTDQDLNIVHEKLIHMFIFDSSLKEFHHVHPEYLNSEWVVEADIAVSGDYRVWAQGQIKEDGDDFAASAKLEVINGAPSHPMPPVLGDQRRGNDGESIVELTGWRFKAKEVAMPALVISRSDGKRPEISPFLGVPVHIMAVPSDGDALIHVHPFETAAPHIYRLHLTFPAAGEYRLWVQFMDYGSLKTVPLSVRVGE